MFDGARDPSTEVALPLGLPHSRRSNRPDLKGRSGQHTGRAAGTVNDVTRSLLPSVCSTCGASYERDTTSARCPECHPTRHQRGEDRRGSAASRGYDRAWRRLSRRARRLQPWCTDCGSPDDLTADHSPAAWDAHERGESITLDMVDVVCRRCNGSRGAARGPDAVERHTIADDHDDLARAGRLVDDRPRGGGLTAPAGDPRGVVEFRTDSGKHTSIAGESDSKTTDLAQWEGRQWRP